MDDDYNASLWCDICGRVVITMGRFQLTTTCYYEYCDYAALLRKTKVVVKCGTMELWVVGCHC